MFEDALWEDYAFTAFGNLTGRESGLDFDIHMLWSLRLRLSFRLSCGGDVAGAALSASATRDPRHLFTLMSHFRSPVIRIQTEDNIRGLSFTA